MSKNKAKRSRQARKGLSQQTTKSRLPLLLALGGVVLLFAAALATWYGNRSAETGFTPEVNDAPRLSVDREKIDLGEVKLGQTVQAAFALKNTGDRPLRFSKAPYIEVVEGC